MSVSSYDYLILNFIKGSGTALEALDAARMRHRHHVGAGRAKALPASVYGRIFGALLAQDRLLQVSAPP